MKSTEDCEKYTLCCWRVVQSLQTHWWRCIIFNNYQLTYNFCFSIVSILLCENISYWIVKIEIRIDHHYCTSRHDEQLTSYAADFKHVANPFFLVELFLVTNNIPDGVLNAVDQLDFLSGGERSGDGTVQLMVVPHGGDWWSWWRMMINEESIPG